MSSKVKYFLFFSLFQLLFITGKAQQEYGFNSSGNKNSPTPSVGDSIKKQQTKVDSLEYLRRLQIQNNMAYQKQELDSLRNMIFNLKREVNEVKVDMSNIQINLHASHKQYKTGLYLFMGGFAAYMIGSIRLMSSPTPQMSDAYFVIGGFLGLTSGIGIMIDSHKHIGRAGRTYERYNYRKRY